MNKTYSFDTTVVPAIDSISRKLSGIPQLQEVLGMLSEEISKRKALANTQESSESKSETIRYITKTYFNYLRLVKDLGNLSSEDIDIIRSANQICRNNGISSNSAFNHGADYFIDTLGEHFMKALVDELFFFSQRVTGVNQSAVNDLSDRMHKGTELAKAGIQTSDGVSKEVDYAIWGHTKGLTNDATIHFVIAHFLERLFTAIFEKFHGHPKIQDMVEHKDTLISAMGDVIYLRTAQGRMDPSISEMWIKDRPEGGLKWNKANKQAVYNSLVRG